jgi:4-carboxymuconolactone decarboxylase
MIKIALVFTLFAFAAPAFASTLNSYDRAALASENWKKLHGDTVQAEATNDPELAAIFKKYVYGDIARQAAITPVERQLVMLVMLTALQNHSLLPRMTEAALNAGATPLQVREALYHVAPYIGFAKVFKALEQVNTVFATRGIKLPLEVQGTTTDADRFEKGLAFQVGTYGERINKMRDATPDYQKHLQDDLSAFCFGDTYTRGTLDLKVREMVTMAVIGAIGGADPQFRSHVAGTLDAGATKEEVIGVITAMNPWMGFPRTLNCLRIANDVFAAREKK